MIRILCDSAVDLSPELKEKYHINTIPFPVFINNKTYLDGVDIQTEELFEMVRKTGVLPKTSAPTIASFTKFFDTPDDIIFLSIGSKLSACHQNALLAAEQIKKQNIHIIDSRNLSTGIGLLALHAAEMRDSGCSVTEIVAELERSIPKIRTSFVVDTLDYIYKGGRCSAVEHMVGSLLHIRPVIEVRSDGTLGVKEKVGGARKKALNAILSATQKMLPTIDLHRIFVTHSGCYQDAAFLVQELQKMAAFEDICTTVAGATIASHCGPDTIGILFQLK